MHRSPRPRRVALVAGLALAGLALSGCAAAVTPSRLGEYEARAELLTTELVAAIPDALGATVAAEDSQAMFGEPMAFDPSRELAWWESQTALTFPDETAAEAALAAVDGYFAADDEGWAVEPVLDTGDGRAVVYRSGDVDDQADDDTEWIVEVHPGDRGLELRVQSPLTVRGDAG